MRRTDDEKMAYLLSRIFEGSRPHSLYRALELGLVPDHYLDEAWAIVESLDKQYPRQPKTAIPARSLYNDPGWDNVIRALEEDR